MARVRNHVIYSDNQDILRRLREEYEMLGRDTELAEGRLTVLALPRGTRTRKQKQQAAKSSKRR